MRTRLTAFLSGILIALLTAGALAAEPGVQRSSAGGVTVTITPQTLSPSARSWDFKVVLDTHSGELNDDLMKSTLLFDGVSGKYPPVNWDGAVPGGHHREGVLRFKPVSPRPQAIEMRITRPGESAPRTFRWQLN